MKRFLYTVIWFVISTDDVTISHSTSLYKQTQLSLEPHWHFLMIAVFLWAVCFHMQTEPARVLQNLMQHLHNSTNSSKPTLPKLPLPIIFKNSKSPGLALKQSVLNKSITKAFWWWFLWEHF